MRTIIATMLALTGATAANAATLDDYKGAWAASPQGCGSPAVTIGAATARTVRVTTSLWGQPREKDVDFTGDPWQLSVMLPGGDGEPRFIALTPKDGKLTLELKRMGPPQEIVGGVALKAGGSAVLVRCADAAPTAIPAGTFDDLVAASARFEKTFGPAWLEGSWGGVDDDLKPVGLLIPPVCPSEYKAYRAKFGIGGAVGNSWETAAPDGTKVTGQGAWVFFRDRSGKTFVANRGLTEAAPLETWDAGKPGAFGVTLPPGSYLSVEGGRRIVTYDLAMVRSSETGEWASVVQKPPRTADTFLYVLKFAKADNPSDADLFVRCR